MARKVERPIIFPLSNPTSRSEANGEDLIHWTDGRALVASGSPFAPVSYGGRKIPIAQCNNIYIFPAMGLGLVASGARRVTEPMMLAAARALAANSPALKDPSASLLPPLTQLRKVAVSIAIAVGVEAQKNGVAPKLSDDELRERVLKTQWTPAYPSLFQMRGELSMIARLERLLVSNFIPGVVLVLGLCAIVGSSALAQTESFEVPADTALRIRLDDTLTSVDSRVGDPFSGTVVEAGEYRNARVYGHIEEIDMSGHVKGHTSMMLRFDRLVMPDGRRAQINAEIVELYHAPSGEKVDVEGAIESGGRGRKSVEHTAIGAGAGALLGGIFGGGKGAGIGSVVGGAGGLGTTAFHGHQKITLSSGQEMLIRITGR